MPAAMTTLKRLAAPIGFVGVGVNAQTLMAGLTGVSGVDRSHLHTRAQRFVSEVQLYARQIIAWLRSYANRAFLKGAPLCLRQALPTGEREAPAVLAEYESNQGN